MISKQPYGRKCSFSCPEGFKLSGPRIKECNGYHGSWSDNNPTICEDVAPPEIICPQDIRTSANPGRNFATVTWNVPKVKDNSGMNVTIWTKPSIRNVEEFKFKLGKTLVSYFAQDPSRNIGYCNFTVEVKDLEKPSVEGCVDPPVFLTADSKGADVEWDEPNIYDNSDVVEIIKSHEFGFFPIGTTKVTYKATDASNNFNICSMNITVQSR